MRICTPKMVNGMPDYSGQGIVAVKYAAQYTAQRIVSLLVLLP